MKKTVITIDGPAGSGKSTVSRLLAKNLGLLYLDTGAMYRAVAFQAKRMGIGPGQPARLKALCQGLDLNFVPDGDGTRIHIGEEDVSRAIRSQEMDMLASNVSAIKEVREAMTGLQRKMAEMSALVAEGRDMGTVVFPEADHKFFITASPEVRAKRRTMERLGRGESISEAEVKRELFVRDEQDTKRLIAPLRPAEDAKMIETTDLTPFQVVELMMREIKK
ncbi:MAG: (d)CMP kinase [Pseudomonadota bacterium]